MAAIRCIHGRFTLPSSPCVRCQTSELKEIKGKFRKLKSLYVVEVVKNNPGSSIPDILSSIERL